MKRLSIAVIPVLVAALLAGCGGGGGDAAMASPAPAPAPAAAGDAFTAAMVALVRSSSDTTEPADVDNVALTMPDGGEPVAVE